jgi:hypothetical protein
MPRPKNVVPLRRDLADEADDIGTPPPNVLGVLHRKDFELWVCRSPRGAVTLKWWRWRGDLEKFFPMEEGELTMALGELKPLAELLTSVDEVLGRKQVP